MIDPNRAYKERHNNNGIIKLNPPCEVTLICNRCKRITQFTIYAAKTLNTKKVACVGCGGNDWDYTIEQEV